MGLSNFLITPQKYNTDHIATKAATYGMYVIEGIKNRTVYIMDCDTVTIVTGSKGMVTIPLKSIDETIEILEHMKENKQEIITHFGLKRRRYERKRESKNSRKYLFETEQDVCRQES